MIDLQEDIINDIVNALKYISAEDRKVWLTMGMAIKSKLGDAGFYIWDNWSQTGSNYNQKDAQATWRSIDSDGGINIATLFYIAKECGYAPDRPVKTSPTLHYVSNNSNQDLESDLVIKADAAAKQASIAWRNANKSGLEHAYIKLKCIEPLGARFQYAEHESCCGLFWTKDSDGNLVRLKGLLLLLPLYNIDGKLLGLQAIDEQGLKSFQKGIAKSGLFMPISNKQKISPDYAGNLFFTEGFATACTVKTATEQPVIMGIDAGNLHHVTKAWRARCPNARMFICGDFDKTGTGQKAANEAAKVCNGCVIFPSQGIKDFNDMARLYGLQAVKELINNSKNLFINKMQPAINIPSSISMVIHPEFSCGVTLTCASSIQPKAIDWIWNGYLASGKLHILAGVPATGKTSIALAFAATISIGGYWPDQTKCEEGNVLIWSGEDDPKDTLVPRLSALGANVNNIHFIEGIIDKDKKSRPFDPSTDFPALHEAAMKIGNIKLVIVDPIVNAVSGDGHQNTNVRRCLQPLVDLAMLLDAAVFGITHFTKGTTGRDPLDRVTGSLAFGALARIVLVAIQDTNSTDIPRYLLSRAKSNIGQDGDGFNYVIEECKLPNNPNITTSIVAWRGIVTGRAKELLCDNTGVEDKITEQDAAKEFLTTLLNGYPMAAVDVYRLAKDQELSKITVDRAKKVLGIQSIKTGFGISSKWMWHLDLKVVKEHEGIHKKLLSTFGQDEDLKEQLVRKFPAIVEDCLLTDVLSIADPGDYEYLQDPDRLTCFTLSLKESGKIRIVGNKNEENTDS